MAGGGGPVFTRFVRMPLGVRMLEAKEAKANAWLGMAAPLQTAQYHRQEKGTRSCGCLMGSEKAAMESDVGLCLKMQRTEMFPCKKKMMLMPQHLPSSSETTVTDFGSTDGGGGGASGGPIFSSRSNQVVGCLSDDVYDVVGAGSGIPQARNTQRFNSDSSFKSSSGGIMGASVRVPFTSVQLQELERQTIIYKYIIASVPIPPQLLVPIAKSRHDFLVSKSNRSWELGYPQNGTDPEPWRCKRTDGKKWRCSRDVAPDQKYCERHAHKNRPRSRKPVELVQQTHSNTSTSSNNSNKNKNHPSLISLPSTNNKLFNNHQQKSQIFNQTMDQFVSPFPAAVSPYEQQPRCSDWSMKGEETASVTTSNQQWENMQFTVGLNDNLAGTDLGDVENDSCSLFLGPKLASLEGALNIDQTERPIRGFIDAWSTAQRESINHCSVSSDGKLPLSSLTLSMAGINGPNEEQEENVPMGLGILDPDRENAGGFKTQSFLNWMSPDSWMGSPPGGPLAEALCLGMASTAKMGSNPNSPHGCNSSVTNSSHGKSPSGDSSQGQGQGQGLNLI